MNLFNLQAAQGEQSMMPMIYMMVLIFVVMYFFIIRPQRKKEKELAKLRDALKKGDEIVTAGGIHGQIMEVQETTVIIAVESAAKIKVEKSLLSVINGVAGAPKK